LQAAVDEVLISGTPAATVPVELPMPRWGWEGPVSPTP
jgi:hypothetical protein